MPVIPIFAMIRWSFLPCSVFWFAKTSWFETPISFPTPLSFNPLLARVMIPLTWIIAVAFITTLVFSVVGGVLMAADKRAAQQSGNQRSGNRVSERKLWLIAVMGGWPGMYLVSQRIRHKTAKRSFRAAFVAGAAIHVLAWIAIAWIR